MWRCIRNCVLLPVQCSTACTGEESLPSISQIKWTIATVAAYQLRLTAAVSWRRKSQ